MNKNKIVLIICSIIIVLVGLLIYIFPYLDGESDNTEKIQEYFEEPKEKSDEDKYEKVQNEGEIKYIDLSDSYNLNDDSSLQKGMGTLVHDETEQEVFLTYFFSESDNQEVIEESGVKVYLGTNDNKYEVVFLFKVGEADFPKYAYGFDYSSCEAIEEDQFDASKEGDSVFDSISSLDGSEYEKLDLIKPLLDYQDKTYSKDENDEIVKVEYTMDAEKYGTYNSSGELFYDNSGRPLYKEYYVTSGTRYTYYLYNEDDKLVQIFDFGGMAYTGLEDNPNIEIGIDFQTYIFER